ncbi:MULTISPECIES: alpha/beta hydrolase [Agrobacterium]|uniref:alpha/beta hydrolase n=1 Tax=Agrobacterium TaxID=357 RepID=UPI000DD43D99|nr:MULTISPECIES: alpha/beta hydrolase [Agrobacterium]MBO9108594.1 alpha/beta hydrolase [Agrobacterium sp. S2/73]MDP9760085.1 acetyl esterase/lipase [Agrobacterium tumefaciens]MDQ1222632.1 acetyl esterase/lipase [Agrobacterium sp. SORGH_AS_0745]NTA15811.1 alpha/beta hydrolase [Agrobacterium tumefaciens]NTA80891.1 alpha/beta hydrolase [Agrobacterium tumefaciens]
MICRRSLLLGGAFLATAMKVPSLFAQGNRQSISLWPGPPPGGGGPNGVPDISKKGAVTNIAVPSLEVFAPAKPNGSAMIIAGGGGYKRIEEGKESYPAARWLADRGIYAFVLTYRLPIEGWAAGPLAPIQDAQRAFRLVRARASDRQIDPHRIGALGFSAGGHLMGLAAARSAFASYEAVDDIDRQSARPDVAALIYPVITLAAPYDHTSTRRSLIGRHPTDEATREWSVESHVSKDCPPVFLTQADDDRISNPANSRIMQQACEKADVDVEFHPIISGGHGFGMGKPGTTTQEWPGWYEAWLRKHNLLA